MTGNPATATPRLFSPLATGLGTFFCGPLAGGVLIGLNYRRLGDHGSAIKAWAAGIVVTVLLLWGVVLVPLDLMDRIPTALIPAICGPLAAFLTGRLQGDRIRQAIAGGAGRTSAWETAGWSLGALVVGVGLFVPFALARPPLGFHGQKHAFGPRGLYQVYYAGRISADARESLERYLTRTGYFVDDTPRLAQLAKRGGTYVLSLGIGRGDWDQPELVRHLNDVRGDLEEFVLRGKVRVEMVDQGRFRIYRREILPGSKP